VAGGVLPFRVFVSVIRIASNSGVMFRGKWTQMIERPFYEQSERSARRPFVKQGTVRGLMTCIVNYKGKLGAKCLVSPFICHFLKHAP